MRDLPEPAALADVWWDVNRITRRRLAFDVAMGIAFGLIFGLAQSVTSPAAVWATVALAVALAVRRVSVPLMLLAGLGAALVQVLTGEVAAVADIAYGPLAFVLGSHPSGTVRRLGLACTLAAVAVAGVWTGVVGNEQFRPTFTAAIGMAALTTVVIGGGWIAGYIRWQQRQAVQARVDAALGAAEQARLEDLYRHERERGRIAADMHDVVAHSWAVVAAQADGARYVLDDDPARTEDALRVIGDTARTAMNDVRGLLAELREDGTAEPVEAPVPDRVIARMRRTGLSIEHARRGAPRSGATAAVAGHVLTEALTNALKHGDHSGPVILEEDWRDGYVVRVANSLPAHTSRGEGHGLRGMAERVAATGGIFSAGREGRHWVVAVRIPALAD